MVDSFYLELAKRYAAPVSNDPKFIEGLAEELEREAERDKLRKDYERQQTEFLNRSEI